MTLYRLITDGEENSVRVNTELDGTAWIDVFYPSFERADSAWRRFNALEGFKGRNLRVQEVKFEV